MNKELTTIHLDPANHNDSVRSFLDFFRLSTTNPGLHCLREILEHFARIPYENLSKIINLNKSPDWESPQIRLPEEVMEDHISYRLGGTCFSLTFFLQSILTSSGFSCYPVMADMRAGRNIHCCLIAVLDSVKCLVDPGYLLTQPMELNHKKPKLFRNEFAGLELRYNAANQRYNLFTFDKNEVKWRYRFQDRPVPPDEFLRHWLHSFGRNSMHGICLTKVMPGGLVFVNRSFMRETTFTGKRNYNIKRNYHSAIHKTFEIEKDLVEQAQVALQENMQRKRQMGLWTPEKK